MEAEAGCKKLPCFLRRTPVASAVADAPSDAGPKDPQAFHHLLSAYASVMEQEEEGKYVHETTPTKARHR